MIDVKKYYSDAWNRQISPSFDKVLDVANNWLTNHGYTPIIKADAMDKLKTDDYNGLCFPYWVVYSKMEKLILSSYEHLEENVKTLFDDSTFDYVPPEKEREETSEENALSKINHVLSAPNDYGVNIKRFLNKTK